MTISKNRPKSMMPSGRFLLCWGNEHGDLRHVGCRVVADDVIDEGDLARRAGGCQPVFVHIAEYLLVARARLPVRAAEGTVKILSQIDLTVLGPVLF